MLMKACTHSSVLLVCLGNICRSPTAEEVFRQQAAIAGLSIKVDSAGTSDWHVGSAPDARSQRHAKSHGYKINKLVARQVSTSFEEVIERIESSAQAWIESWKAC